ncbi:unnamed protein product [Blepharisma stoltei]|uniref:Uncharacterized protein n=1 Tax=Blepharisma stoltei TaxID=1481888 RepID=A0AAU9JG15_9CILI|nr:unnamed protein product [Blepharisma stoltei]
MINERKQIYGKNFPDIYRDMIMYREINKNDNEPDPLHVILGVIESYLYYDNDRKQVLIKCLSDLISLNQRQPAPIENAYNHLMQIINTRDINFLDNLSFYNEEFWDLLKVIKDNIENICGFESFMPYNILFKISCMFQVSIRIVKTVETSDLKMIQYGNVSPIVDIFFNEADLWYIMYPELTVRELFLPRHLDKVYHCGCHNSHGKSCPDKEPYTIEDEPCSFYIVLFS